MKYAIISMIVIYLLTFFGCNPGKDEEKSAAHSPAAVSSSVTDAGHSSGAEDHGEKPVSDPAKLANGNEKPAATVHHGEQAEPSKPVSDPATLAASQEQEAAASPYEVAAQNAAQAVMALMDQQQPGPAATTESAAVAKSEPEKSAAPVPNAHMDEALRQVIKATNDLVEVTQRLMFATEKMISARQEAAQPAQQQKSE
jgi:cytoskeletal protein RodZ